MQVDIRVDADPLFLPFPDRAWPVGIWFRALAHRLGTAAAGQPGGAEGLGRSRYAIWADALGRAVQRSPRPPVLVAHSLGCILVSRWLAAAPRASVAGAFLVAPVDVDRLAGDPRFDIQGFDPVATSRLPCSTAVVASRTDEYVDFARAEYFARCWGSAFLDAGDLGHMGDAARLGDWPAGLGFLEKFVATLHA